MSVTPHLIGRVHNVEHENRIGCARVFEDEAQAEKALWDWYCGIGEVICCGGFWNAVWKEYKV